MTFLTGDTPTIDEGNVSQSKGSKAEVNLGLNPYFRYDAVFDVARGRVSFAPCTAVSPPSTMAIPVLSPWAMGLLALGLALFGAMRVPRRLGRDRR